MVVINNTKHLTLQEEGFRCKHNLSYWKYTDYIGVGPGAHGRIKISGKRYATEEEINPDIWLKKTLLPPQEHQK